MANEPVELAGQWIVKLDPDDRGESENWRSGFSGTAIELPGICTEAGLGESPNLGNDEESKVFRHLYPHRRYIGSAWYQRDFEIPKDFQTNNARLILERVLWRSKVWINGVSLGSGSSLSTAHQFSTAGILRAGKNRIVICVDNREQVPMGTLSHGYTEQTQTIWNGVLGCMEIAPKPPVSIERLFVTPVPGDGVVNVSVEVKNRTQRSVSIPVLFGLEHLHGSSQESQTELVMEFPVGSHGYEVELPAKDLRRWSEFSPSLYRVSCKLGDHQADFTTGFRSLEAKDSQIHINGRRSFMRGTLDCCIFPRTGYPPTDVESWLKQFNVAKSYGLNHIRFHSWCPPEAAFAAADQLGMYLQVELPNWTDDMGKDKQVSRFLRSEGERILRSYAHHPSFMFFSLGNELNGDFDFMDQLLTSFQSKANHILMTSTSFSFSRRGEEPGPNDQFFVTQRSKSGWIRGQRFFNRNPPETDSDFREGVASINRPLISHEIGQYSVYPNLEEITKFDGNLRSLALESIQADLRMKARLADARLATENSGSLALTLYKEEIERAIRTPGQDGFQLLGLADFTGQSTATVGLLDAFWDSKGIVEPEEFRRFCSSTVPLLRIGKRCFNASETLTAKVQVGHFGPQPMLGTNWKVMVKQQDEVLFEKDYSNVDVKLGNAIDIGEFAFPLNKKILRPCQLTVSVFCEGTRIENHWSVWVYPDFDQPVGSVEVFRLVNEKMLAALERGASVLLLPRRDSIRKPIDGRFVPVFWSPLHFPDQSPTHGTIIRDNHPVFRNFPTDSHTDWQWWELLAESTSIDMSSVAMGRSFPVMRFIDKFNRNAMPAIMWEAKVGNGKLFVCSLDIESRLHERPVAKALWNSIIGYMNKEAFDPSNDLDPSRLETLFN